MSVPNSVPPVAPVIRYVMPSYGWDAADPAPPEIATWTSFKRRRSGGGVRVFLDRPWFTSGPDEKLGVVLAPAATPEDASRHTRLGVDPTTNSLYAPAMAHLAPAMFSAGSAYPGVLLEDGVSQVDVVGYDPILDVARNQWYADVTVDMAALPEDSYAPFIRLAVCRFQPASVPKTHASKVILAEFVQLAPDRLLEATVAGDQLTVVVTGRGPRHGPANEMIIALDEADGANPGELDWRPLGSASGPTVPDDLDARLAEAVSPTPLADGFQWQKTLTIPGTRGTQALRLIVREVEFRRGDDDPSLAGEVAEEVASEAVLAARLERRIPRIVYADAVRLG